MNYTTIVQPSQSIPLNVHILLLQLINNRLEGVVQRRNHSGKSASAFVFDIRVLVQVALWCFVGGMDIVPSLVPKTTGFEWDFETFYVTL